MSAVPLASLRAAARDAPAYCWQNENSPSKIGQSSPTLNLPAFAGKTPDFEGCTLDDQRLHQRRRVDRNSHVPFQKLDIVGSVEHAELIFRCFTRRVDRHPVVQTISEDQLICELHSMRTHRVLLLFRVSWIKSRCDHSLTP